MMYRLITASVVTCLGVLCAPAHADVILGSNGDPDEANATGITAAGWVRSDDASRRAGGETLFVGGTNGSNDFRGFLSFDLSGVSGTATGATLSLWSQGFDGFNASGGDQDLGLTPLNIVAMSDTITGYGDGAGANAVVDGTGDPAHWTNTNGLYGAVIGTADVDIDNVAFGTRIDITITDLAYVNAALGGTITFGIQAPGAQADGSRNFFALSGVVENTLAGDDTAPSLEINGVVPEPTSLALLSLGGMIVSRRRRANGRS